MDFWNEVHKGNFSNLKLFIEENPSYCQLKNGLSILDHAFRCNQSYEMISYLIEKGARLTIFDIPFTSLNFEQKIIDLIFNSHKFGIDELNLILISQFKNEKTPIKLIEIILKKGANPNIENKTTPLFYLLNNQKYEGDNNKEERLNKLQLLIKYGVDVNKTNPGLRPLNFVLSSNLGYEFVELLSKSGANWEKEDFDIIPSRFLYSIEYVKLFCEKIPDINYVNENETILHKVLRNYPGPNKEIVIILLEAGANPNLQNKGFTGLHIIVSSYYNEDIFRLLLKYGADISIKNNKGETPLDLIASGSSYSSNFSERFHILEEFGYKFDFNEKPPYIFRCFRYNSHQPKSFEVIKKLVALGADINEVHDGNCILNLFNPYSVDISDLKTLFDLGFDYKKLKGKISDNPIAVRYGYSSRNQVSLEKFKLLVEKGFPIEFDSHKPIIFEFLSFANPKEALETILDCGLNPNIHNYNNQGIFSWIYDKIKNRADFFKILIDGGIDIESQKKDSSFKKMEAKYIDLIEKYGSIMEDFNELFKRKEFCDFNIAVEDGTIQTHKLILEMRIGKEKITKFLEKCETKNQEEIKPLVQFIYSGLANGNEYEKIVNLCEEFEIDFNKKKGKKGIIEDLKKLYEDEESKDFTFKFDEKNQFKVHKLILITRSELFRNMFLSVNDSSNCVQNYSSFSLKSLQIFFEYLYTDQISFQPSLFLMRELKTIPIYFQLNPKSYLSLQIEEIRYYLRSKLFHPDKVKQNPKPEKKHANPDHDFI
ncbi:ankyrin repeat domain-containing protein [Anaeramoeba ignava]|uniref:Ankyrin repeat domain-containing protein n=1 Tax=Anaeramoeba ignava TaxID=1746090 RepID=A0A9Q0LTS8_ANAIG|nr:ankyrin repeat domain-containing protein [Anaeramoeba ignava]